MGKVSSFGVITFGLLLSLIGWSMIPFLSVQTNSARTSKTLVITFQWPGYSARLVEKDVTTNLESLFNRMSSIQEVKSSSHNSGGQINIQFKNNTNMQAARFEIASIIRQNMPRLPKGVSYPEIQDQGGEEQRMPVLTYSIVSLMDADNLKKYIEQKFIKELSKIPGFARETLSEEGKFEWLVTYNPVEMGALGLSLAAIVETMNEYARREDLGFTFSNLTDQGGYRATSVQLVSHSEADIDWGKIPIAEVNDRVVYLGDIAEIKLAEASIHSLYRLNGRRAVNLSIYCEPGINMPQFSKAVRQKIHGIASSLQRDIKMDLVHDSTEYLTEEFHKIIWRALIICISLVFGTYVFYRSQRWIVAVFISLLVNLSISLGLIFLFEIKLQLYSISAICISVGLVWENILLISEYVREGVKKKGIFILTGSTLIRIASVSIVFLLEDVQKEDLSEFSSVILINQVVSLFVSYFVFPAIIEKIVKIRQDVNQNSNSITFRMNGLYTTYSIYIKFLNRKLVRAFIVASYILLFGIPFYLIPNKVDSSFLFAVEVNTLLENPEFIKIKTFLDNTFGGSISFFSKHVLEHSFYSKPEKTRITILATMPEGSTLEQIDQTMSKAESYIGQFKEIDKFETTIYTPRRAAITVLFKPVYGYGSFPYEFKGLLENWAVGIDGVDWTISGVGKAFTNSVGNEYKDYRISLEGYDYDQLTKYADELSSKITGSSNGRVSDVDVNSTGWDMPVKEYILRLQTDTPLLVGSPKSQLYHGIQLVHNLDVTTSITLNHQIFNLRFSPNSNAYSDVWDLNNRPIPFNGNYFKIGSFAKINTRLTTSSIEKVDQQYRLIVAYSFIGPEAMGKIFIKKMISETSSLLPLGFRAREYFSGFEWNRDESSQYYYILLSIYIIFSLCAILLESFKQALAATSLIPFSFLGAFWSFYFFDINFNQGAYVGFVLISGISVLPAIFILTRFNRQSKLSGEGNILTYCTALSLEFRILILRYMSLVVCLGPFLLWSSGDFFWYPFVVSLMSALTFSLLGAILILPSFFDIK